MILLFTPKAKIYFYENANPAQTVTENDVATMVCHLIVGYQNNQTVDWLWYFNNVQLNMTNRMQLTSNASESQLKMSGLTVNDAGLYTCEARNEYGNMSQTVQLRVKSILLHLSGGLFFI